MDSYHHDGLAFDVLDAGPSDGEAVVLLHGFPQDARSWSSVTPGLHAAGLRTLAPHQRGYSPGARPRKRSDYRAGTLVGDVVALLDTAGLDRVHLVGHDWGGIVAWWFALNHPDRLSSLTVLSTPHPDAFVWSFRHSDQLRRSWYMLAMQLPVLPEAAFARGLRRGQLAQLGLPREHTAAYTERLQEPDALRSAIHWYRGMPFPPGLSRTSGRVLTPTTFVWGRRDPFLGRAAAERTAVRCGPDYRFAEVDAGHWLPELEPQRVTAEILRRCRGVR